MPNMANIIASSNKNKIEENEKISSGEKNSIKGCKCRENPCPLNGNCEVNNIVYKASVICEQEEEKVYYGLTSTKFIERFRNHKSSFTHRNRHITTLSKEVWRLKNIRKSPQVKFSIFKCTNTIQAGGKKCNVCLFEKQAIIEHK